MSTHAVLHHPGPPHKYVSPQVSAANTRIKAVLGTSLSLTDALLVPRGWGCWGWGWGGGVCHGRRFTFLLSFISRSSIHHDYRLGRWIQKDEWHSDHDTISPDYSTKLHLDAFFLFVYLIVAALSSVSWFAVSNWNSLCWMITWSKLTL